MSLSRMQESSLPLGAGLPHYLSGWWWRGIGPPPESHPGKRIGASSRGVESEKSSLLCRDTLDYLDSLGVSYSWSPTDTTEMNSVTERKWRTLNKMTRCLLMRSGLPTDFWWDAYQAAVWIHNRTPTKTARGWMTPYEFIHGEAPDISNLRIWGC